MPRKQYFLSYLVIIFLILCLTCFKHDFFDVNSSSATLKFSENNRIIWPSMMNPISVENGELVYVIFQSSLENNPINAVLYNNYISYTIPIQETMVRESGEKVAIFEIPSYINCFLYNLELFIDRNHRITTYNAVKVMNNDPDRIDTYSFIHLTDTHFDGSEDRTTKMIQLISEINLIHPDFAIMTGDLVDGLISDSEGKMITAADQFPEIVELLKTFKIPVLLINGNHDFQTNKWQDGNTLWEKYLGPVEWIIHFSYRQDLYVGCSIFDENGLRADQISDINEIFENPSLLKVFFAHTDYQNQFSSIYKQNGVNLSLLGHEHASSSKTVSGTLEFVTDNSITLIDTEPGHYRLFSISSNKEIETLEIEVNKLKSLATWELKDESTVLIKIGVKNLHDFDFQNLSEEILIPGNWTSNTIAGSESHLYFNGTDTLLTTRMHIKAKTETHYYIELTKNPSNISWNASSFDLETSLKKSSKDRESNRTDIALFENEIFLIGALLLLLVQIKRRKKKKRKK